MYATKTDESASRTCSRRWKGSRMTTAVIPTAATGTESQGGTSTSSRLAATPASSAQVVPALATTSAASAATAMRPPKRSRTSSMRPRPVLSPMRAPSSWNAINATVESARTQRS